MKAELDGRPVEKITAYLFHAGGHEDPRPLQANAGKSFIGSYVLGMGFTFDDSDAKGVATPLAEMRRLIDKDPRNAMRIFPYIGGEEVNGSPTHAPHRYVIHFADFPLRRADLGESWAGADGKQREAWLRTGLVPLDYPEPVAADWPDLLEIVERKVKPERDKLKGNTDAERRRKFWWQWGRYTPALFAAVQGLERVLACSQTSKYLALAFLPANMVYSHKAVIFPFSRYDGFAVLQSSLHECWARFMGSTMKDDPVYTPSDCFETFPFPPDVGANSFAHSTPETGRINSPLQAAGRDYYEFRAGLMVRNDEGLTQTYNRFHDPEETSPEILRLRELHAAMDRAVLDAYGWDDIPTACEFILDFEDEEDDSAEAAGGRASRKKKPWRYRWPDEVRDEVLARLLAQNAERAAEEARAGMPTAAEEQKAGKPAVRKGRKPKPETQPDLFSGGD